MPRYVVGRVQDALNDVGQAIKGANVLVLGVAYKPDVTDMRESPALDVIGLLKEKGSQVSYYDPHVAEITHEGWKMKSVSDLGSAVEQADIVVLITDHKELDYATVAKKAHLIFDTRNAFQREGFTEKKIVRL
jgi:UDP-N-acetyl-D-glucosamine dehydrogenase